MQYRNGVWRPCSLKRLAQEELGWNIQQGSHDSVVDARAALALYQRYAAGWEQELTSGGATRTRPQGLSKHTVVLVVVLLLMNCLLGCVLEAYLFLVTRDTDG
jgi:hypothetical protein